MTRILFFLVTCLAALIAWRLSDVLSADAVGMAVGVMFGVMAALPAALLLLAAGTRRGYVDRQPRHRQPPGYVQLPQPEQPERLPTPPTIIIVNTGQPQSVDNAQIVRLDGGR